MDNERTNYEDDEEDEDEDDEQVGLGRRVRRWG